MRSPAPISFLFLALLLAVVAATEVPKLLAEQAKTKQLASVLGGAEETFTPDVRSAIVDCQVNGPLPDHACSPGAIFADATVAQICVPGYTKTVRNVPQSLKHVVYAEYGLDYHQPTGSYEVDHLIPLALGGSNDIANLFPEAAEPAPGFHEKDIVELYLHDEMCAGHIDLHTAQDRIAHDWLTIYQNMPADDITRIKSEFRNWADTN